MSTWYICESGDSFSHHGILGMKWGVRRYTNPDGTLTDAGRDRYYGESSKTKRLKRKLEKTAGKESTPANLARQMALTRKIQRSAANDQRQGAYRYAMDSYKTSDRIKDTFQYGLFGSSKLKKYMGYSGATLAEARGLMDKEREYKQYDKEVKKLKKAANREKRKTGYDSYKDNLNTLGENYGATRKLADTMQKGRKYSKTVLNAIGYKGMTYSQAMDFALARDDYEKTRKEARAMWKHA